MSDGALPWHCFKTLTYFLELLLRTLHDPLRNPRRAVEPRILALYPHDTIASCTNLPLDKLSFG